MTKKHSNIMTFQQKCTNLRDFYLVKKGPKNLGIGKPPPTTFGQCPKVSDFFLRMSSLTQSINTLYWVPRLRTPTPATTLYNIGQRQFACTLIYLQTNSRHLHCTNCTLTHLQNRPYISTMYLYVEPSSLQPLLCTTSDRGNLLAHFYIYKPTTNIYTVPMLPNVYFHIYKTSHSNFSAQHRSRAIWSHTYLQIDHIHLRCIHVEPSVYFHIYK